MSKELLKHENLGSFDEIMFVLKEALSVKEKSINDIKQYCMVSTRFKRIPVSGILSFLDLIEYINLTGARVNLSSKGLATAKSEKSVKSIKIKIIDGVLGKVKESDELSHFINFSKLSFDTSYMKHTIKNNSFLLKFSALKNLFIDFGFFEISKESMNLLLVNPDMFVLFEKELKLVKSKQSLEAFRKQQLLLEELGNQAEEYVLSFELKRLKDHKLIRMIQRISPLNVSAGYDLISFDSIKSTKIDRFIEVKSYSRKPNFFWSDNEIKIAQIKGGSYYLYLVNRDELIKADYQPIIIRNPYKNVFSGEQLWNKKCQNWFISQTIVQ